MHHDSNMVLSGGDDRCTSPKLRLKSGCSEIQKVLPVFYNWNRDPQTLNEFVGFPHCKMAFFQTSQIAMFDYML